MNTAIRYHLPAGHDCFVGVNEPRSLSSRQSVIFVIPGPALPSVAKVVIHVSRFVTHAVSLPTAIEVGRDRSYYVRTALDERDMGRPVSPASMVGAILRWFGSAREQVGSHLAFALDLDEAAWCEGVGVFEPLIDLAGHLDR